MTMSKHPSDAPNCQEICRRSKEGSGSIASLSGGCCTVHDKPPCLNDKETLHHGRRTVKYACHLRLRILRKQREALGLRLSAIDLRRLQKVVISRWIQGCVPHAPRVHQHVIEIPQVDIGLILRQHLLNFSVQALAGVLIGLAARLVDQTINPRIGIKSAICPLGRESVGMKGILENVRIFIAADPAQRIKLESAAGDVGKKSSELKRANVERNAH